MRNCQSKGGIAYIIAQKAAAVHSTLTSEHTGSRYEPACVELRYPCAKTPDCSGRAATMLVRNAGGSRTATTRRQIMRLPPSHRHKQWGRLRANHAEVTSLWRCPPATVCLLPRKPGRRGQIGLHNSLRKRCSVKVSTGSAQIKGRTEPALPTSKFSGQSGRMAKTVRRNQGQLGLAF